MINYKTANLKKYLIRQQWNNHVKLNNIVFKKNLHNCPYRLKIRLGAKKLKML